MIREEYERTLKNSGGDEVDRSVKMSRKEIKMRAKIGDRGYCGKEIEKCKELKKATDFSTTFTLIVAVLCFALYFWFYNLDKKSVSKVLMIVITVFLVLMVLWSLVWFLGLRIGLNKKTNRLKAEVDEWYKKDKEEQMKKYERIKRLREQNILKQDKK